MRFPYLFCGCVAAAVFLLGAALHRRTSWSSRRRHNTMWTRVRATVGDSIAPFLTTSSSQPLDLPPYRWAAQRMSGAPNCAGSLLSATPAPSLSVGATTSLNHTSQSSTADANVTYDYEVLCHTCPPGTLVPLSISGVMEAHYIRDLAGPWHSRIWRGFL